MERERIGIRVSLQTMIGNILLSALKLTAGIVAHSAAMISDAVHSMSDIAGTVVVMIGLRVGGRDADRDHPYGHERIECVAAIVLSGVLAATGAIIGFSGVKVLLGGEQAIATPGLPALIAAIISIVVKEAMYWYTRHAAKKINSSALMAEAWHHRSDALSSVGSFIGIFGARLGWALLDPLAGIVISVFILKAALSIFRDAISKMTDRACDEATIALIEEVICTQEGVLGIDQMKTRLFGDKMYVDVEICVNGTLPLVEAHAIAQRVHDAVEQAFPLAKHCVVHVNPDDAEKES